VGGPSDLRAMAILAIADRRLLRWPRPARIAFRNAVLADPTPFLIAGEVDRGAVLIEAESFLAAWERGLPWPLVGAALPAPAADAPAPREIQELAALAAAVGIRLALAMTAGR
jgi:hypothetical protein